VATLKAAHSELPPRNVEERLGFPFAQVPRALFDLPRSRAGRGDASMSDCEPWRQSLAARWLPVELPAALRTADDGNLSSLGLTAQATSAPLGLSVQAVSFAI
jgi:hypothetical protein